METQNARLLRYLRSAGSIEPLSALRILGIYRLGARIYDLRSKGHDIYRELIEVPCEYGGTSRVARYTLLEGAAS